MPGSSEHREFNFRDLERMKEESRRDDARALASGEKSREQLRRENSLFSGRGAVLKLNDAKRLS